MPQPLDVVAQRGLVFLAEKVAEIRHIAPLMGAAHKDHWATIGLHVGQGHPGGEEFAALFPDLPVVAILVPADGGRHRFAGLGWSNRCF